MKQFSELKGDLSNYEKALVACRERQKIKDQIAALEGELALKSSAEDSQKAGAHLETLIAEKTSQKLDIAEFQESLKKAEDQNNLTKYTFQNLIHRMICVESKLEKLAIKIDLKAEKHDLSRVEMQVVQLPNVEIFNEHKRYIHDNIDQFKTDNALFKHEFKMQCEMIRRYDEVISQKSSKMALE